jgi:dihydropteroate synthase
MNHQPSTLNQAPAPQTITIRDRPFHWGQRTYLMGVLNVTPDSFSDGGLFDRPESALAQARHLIASGADILDIGGQSTRPGATEVPLDEERDRVVPIIQALRRDRGCNLPISVDTNRSQVAKAAIEAGADLVNDVSGGTADPEMLSVVSELKVPFVLMHMRGTPQTMQQLTDYGDLIGEISALFARQIASAIAAGIPRHQIILDPGIGFAKTYDHNLTLLRELCAFRSFGLPLLVGPSRKSFIGRILERSDPKQRVWGTAATCCAAIAAGADIIRVHDIPEMHDVCRVADAIYRP